MTGGDILAIGGAASVNSAGYFLIASEVDYVSDQRIKGGNASTRPFGMGAFLFLSK